MTDRVTAHAQSVCSGLIKRKIGKSEYLCCKRHLKDLERQGTAKFPYVFDAEKSLTMIDFAEMLILAEGDEVRPLKLWGFQDFIFGSWQGWIHKDTKRRRFRTSYFRVARQNGKSLGNAIPTMYYGNFSGYQYPQIYCVATKADQAKIVMNECSKFINSDVELSGTKTKAGMFTVQDYKSEIQCNLTHGVIRALGRDTKSIDGFRPYFGSVDEYHAHKDDQMYKLLTGGTKKLKECLISVITTAGFDLNCPCKSLDDHCHKVIMGAVEDETRFIYICELDKEDDVWDETNWEKAHPLWTPETLDSLRAEAITAKDMGGSELRDFLTKGLNQWVQLTDNQYMDVEKFVACGDETSLEDMRGKECYLGLDLSSGGDLTSGALEFPLLIDNEKKYFIHSHSFLPSKRLAEHIQSDKAPYDMWVRDKLITLTETLGGVKVDYKYIIQYYKDLIEKYDLKLLGIGYDPHNADAFLSDLEEFSVDCTMISQSCKSLNDATVDFRLEVDAGNIIYNKNDKLLIWSFTNAQKVSNSFGEIKIDKDLRIQRIDPCDACMDAHKLAFKSEVVIDYDSEMDSYLKKMGWDE